MNPNLPGGGATTQTTLQTQRLRFGLTFAATGLRTGHAVAPHDHEPGVDHADQARRHIVDLGVASAALDVAYAPLPWLALEANVPLRAVLSLATFLDEEGKVMDGFRSIHHRDELLFGAADPRLSLRLQGKDLLVEDLSGGLRVGSTLPVGNTVPDPFALGRAGKEHQHVFFGSGTFDPVFGFDLAYTIDDVRLGGFVDTRVGLYPNAYGFTGPTTVSLGTFADASFGLEDWTFRLSPELFLESPARWPSGTGELTGRADALLTGGAFWRVRDNLQLEALLKVTLVNWAVEGFYQLYAPAVLVVGARWDVPLHH